mgnify:FL=1
MPGKIYLNKYEIENTTIHNDIATSCKYLVLAFEVK